MAGTGKRNQQKKKNGADKSNPESDSGDEVGFGDDANNFEYLQNQNKQERIQLRRQYRILMEDLNQKKHDFINPETDSLTDALKEANELNKQVRLPREGALDSATILMISTLARQKVDALKTDFIKFEPIEYAEKLLTFIRGANQLDSDGHISANGWTNLGSAAQRYFQRSPAFHFMVGSFERSEPKQKVVKRQKKDTENINDKATVPKQMKSFEESGKDEATTAEVERVYGILRRYYSSEENPICYFEFVLNPESFGQTIENIFYASFLIRDGLARISLDEDGLPVIEPIDNPEGQQQKQKGKNHQAIVSMTPQEWKELLQVYKVKVPLIPTRATLVDSEPLRPHSGPKKNR